MAEPDTNDSAADAPARAPSAASVPAGKPASLPPEPAAPAASFPAADAPHASQGAVKASVPPHASQGAVKASVPPSTLEETVPRAGARSTTARAATPSDASALAAYEELARAARLGDLIGIVGRVVGDLARARTAAGSGARVAELAEEARLGREDADTRFGNVLDVLAKGADGVAERALASALWAHAVAESPRSKAEDEDRLVGDVVWLAAHTAFDATPLLDRALGEDASDLWVAIAAVVRRPRQIDRGEQLVACAALAASSSERAKSLCVELARELNDPVLLRVLGAAGAPATSEVRLEGEIAPAPRSPLATVVLAFTGILLAVHVVRLLARLALAYRRPAEVLLSDSGVRVKTRTELLGRTLRERDHVILRSGLVRVVREVRFPRAAFYAGLLALAIGSYIGVRAFADGVRSASPSLLLVGLVIVALGVAADFVLGTLLPGSRGVCRIAFVPRTGPVLCVGDIDLRRADDALGRALSR